jgi:hypothetical protein
MQLLSASILRLFFTYLQRERRDLLLDFKSTNDKWKIVHSWLLGVRRVKRLRLSDKSTQKCPDDFNGAGAQPCMIAPFKLARDISTPANKLLSDACSLIVTMGRREE